MENVQFFYGEGGNGRWEQCSDFRKQISTMELNSPLVGFADSKK